MQCMVVVVVVVVTVREAVHCFKYYRCMEYGVSMYLGRYLNISKVTEYIYNYRCTYSLRICRLCGFQKFPFIRPGRAPGHLGTGAECKERRSQVEIESHAGLVCPKSRSDSNSRLL